MNAVCEPPPPTPPGVKAGAEQSADRKKQRKAAPEMPARRRLIGVSEDWRVHQRNVHKQKNGGKWIMVRRLRRRADYAEIADQCLGEGETGYLGDGAQPWRERVVERGVGRVRRE